MFILRTLLFFLASLLAACTVVVPSPWATLPDLQSAAQGAAVYLEGEYDRDLGLLRESPETAPDRYWLATDNQLAVYALEAVENELAKLLAETIARHQERRHGLIEALVGERVAWPPHAATQRPVEGKIWHEDRLSGVQYEDWQAYADLALYGALAAYNDGDGKEAQRRYRQAVKMFDGTGFADLAFRVDGRYATYKLALALYVAGVIGELPDTAIVDALLAKQVPSGGFSAMYDEAGGLVGDTNTETTAYALLALAAVDRRFRMQVRTMEISPFVRQ